LCVVAGFNTRWTEAKGTHPVDKLFNKRLCDTLEVGTVAVPFLGAIGTRKNPGVWVVLATWTVLRICWGELLGVLLLLLLVLHFRWHSSEACSFVDSFVGHGVERR